jgi:3-hydroxyisobutyrate dehydrogenase-like beta-hydroxyacid dehydrogenase
MKEGSVEGLSGSRLGWIGAGRMGTVLCGRLLAAGCDVHVFNRTRSKTEPLAAMGATVVDSPADLGDRDIVFTIVATSTDLLEVVDGDAGVLSRPPTHPGLLVDLTTVSIQGSEEVRRRCEAAGSAMLASPVSGNPKVARAGRLTLVASGPAPAFETAAPYLRQLGMGVTYVGQGEAARLVKICHNLFLGVVTQSLAEITILAERGGVARADLLAFINDSVMGSVFSRYKTPAFVNLDFTPTFTGHLLRKDFELGLAAGRELDVPLPVSALVHQIVTELIGRGFGDQDFATLLELEALGAGMQLSSEGRDIDDGLSPVDDKPRLAVEGA